MNKDSRVGIFINVPKEYCVTKEELGMTWAGIIKNGIDAIERNKQYYKLVELIDKLSRENEKLTKLVRSGVSDVTD